MENKLRKLEDSLIYNLYTETQLMNYRKLGTITDINYEIAELYDELYSGTVIGYLINIYHIAIEYFNLLRKQKIYGKRIKRD
jgi:hypothetical protein